MSNILICPHCQEESTFSFFNEKILICDNCGKGFTRLESELLFGRVVDNFDYGEDDGRDFTPPYEP